MIFKSYLIEKNINDLKNKITLFYGENLGLKEEFKNRIRKNFNKAHIISLVQEEILKNNDLFYEKLLNESLFENQKVFFIDQVNDKVLTLIEDIENRLDNQKVFLFAEILDKKSKLRSYFEKSKDLSIVACYNDTKENLRKIILEKLKKFKGLSTENINIILSSGLNRVKLNNEIKKIETFFTNKELDGSKLSKLLNLNENDDFDILKDAALNGDKIKTNTLLNETLIEDSKIIFYLNSLNHRLNKLKEILMKSTKSAEDAINQIKPPIFWMDKPKILTQLKKWNSTKIRLVLNNTFEIEKTFKSSSSLNKNILIKKLIIDICNQANA